MKKATCLALLLALVLLPATAARADVIYTPFSNFVDRHYADMTYVGRDYYVTGDEGTLLHDEPGSRRVVGRAPEGIAYEVYYTYVRGGTTWGLVEPRSPESIAAWLDMADMALAYDAGVFREEHASRFEPYTGDYSELAEAAPLVIWDYPGAAQYKAYLGNGLGGEAAELLHTYTDELGRRWGYSNYLGHVGGTWVLLDDPGNTDPGGYRDMPYTGRGIYEPMAGTAGGLSATGLLVAVLIVAVVVGTAVLIKVLYKPTGR